MDEGWRRTIDAGFGDPGRSRWDAVVASEIADYNARLASTTGYAPVEAKKVLAMIWVESGGPKRADWTGRAMQMGNPGDQGFPELKAHRTTGATELVVRAELLTAIDAADNAALQNPAFNIQCGIAYLFERMASVEVATMLDDAETHEHTVGRGESAAVVAAREHTTIDEIRASSPDIRDIGRLQIGDVLHFRRAHRGRRISGWAVFDFDTMASHYNGGGDPQYAEKLRYVYAKLIAD